MGQRPSTDDGYETRDDGTDLTPDDVRHGLEWVAKSAASASTVCTLGVTASVRS